MAGGAGSDTSCAPQVRVLGPLCAGGMWLPSPTNTHILPIAFETEQEDETQAPGEGKGVEERQFWPFQSYSLSPRTLGPCYGGFGIVFICC